MSDAITEDELNKWMCEYCTYVNFQSSLKCTMCKGQKPLLNEDIFRLSPSQQQSNSNENDELVGLAAPIIIPEVILAKQVVAETIVDSTADSTTAVISNSAVSIPNNATNTNTTTNTTTAILPPLTTASGASEIGAEPMQWTCNTCTYLNWAKTLRCCQCGMTKSLPQHQQRLDTDTINNDVNDHMKALSICGSDPDIVAALGQQRTSPMGSTTNLSGSRKNLGAGARISPVDTNRACYPMHKWSCSVCTFENWPKSLKCSMCGHQTEMLTTTASNTSSLIDCVIPTNASDVTNNISNANVATNTLSTVNLQSSPDREFDENNCATNYIISNTNKRNNAQHRYQLGNSDSTNNCDSLQERRIRQLRRQADWQWLHACIGVVENNFGAVEAYMACGGNPGRSLTSSEVALLNRNSAYDVGHTLIHLAIRFHREEMLPMLLSQISGSGPGIKRVPSYVAPDLASDIRRHFATSLRIRKAQFNCHYVNEHATFALPAEIEELPIAIQEQLSSELLDRDAQAQLEDSTPALNWSLEITVRLGSRLMVLWNRSAGDCLLDSAMQATWGVFDRDNVLRRALADSLRQCGHIFYARWKEYEMTQAALLHFTLEETQWDEDWSTLLSLASQPGSSLEQLHIFALAHILRRPIIVYGVKYVKSFRGEDIGYARFEGLYIPLLWEQSFCIKSPIALGYTRGHFSALVPTEPYSRIDATRVDSEDVTFLPLMDCEHKLLPIHFLTQAEMGCEESIMRQWLDVCVTEGGLLVAQQKLQKRPLLVAQMLEEWLNHYRRIAQVMSGPYSRRRGTRANTTGYSSDGDTDEE